MAKSHKSCMEQAEIIDTFGLYQGSRSLRKVLDKSSIETSMTMKTTNTFDVPWIGHPFNIFNFCLVHFNSPLGNLVTKNDPFVNHEVALLLIEHLIHPKCIYNFCLLHA